MNEEFCSFDRLDYDIHEIRVLKSARQTIDAIFGYLEEVYSATKPDETVRVIINNSNDLELPIAYLASKSRNLTAVPRPFTRIAVLTRSGTIINITLNLLNAMRFAQSETRVFDPDKREDAINWLLRD